VRRASDVFGNLRVVSQSTGSWPVGQQTSRASNYVGVQAQGQKVFIDTSNKVVSIMQGDRFLSLYRITRWEQFLASMKGKGLQFAPGDDWETLRMAMGQ
jgi:hypothetical protein